MIISMEFHELTIPELHEALVNKETSVGDLVSFFRALIEKANPRLNAFLDTNVEQPGVIETDSSVLAGIPFAVKDVIVLSGHICRGSSRVLEGYRSPYTATVLRKLLDADAVVLGRTNCDEFAMGGSTENSGFGPTHNPWELNHVPGGSSGGSAAAVAAWLVPYALGSDTGGSIREPAALCGIVGVKPTYGRVSRYGLIAMALSLDQIGPITRTVEDAALV